MSKTKEKNEVKVLESQGERFVNMAIAELNNSGLQGLIISDYEKSLIYNSFIKIDSMLKEAESKRNAKYQALEYNWNNVNLEKLAIDCAHNARLGLDMLQENFLNPIPYKNNKTNKYDIGFIKGYKGLEFIAYEFALDKPTAITTELVYSTDTFKPVKKSRTNKVESYEFEITEPFDRGEITGGFGYIEYENPNKNELVILSIEEIEKRRPEKYSSEFWGGEKDVWVDGKKTNKKEKVDGWFDEMCLKTVKRATYKKVPLDPKKINSSYKYFEEREIENTRLDTIEEQENYANKDILDFGESEAREVTEDGEIIEDTLEEEVITEETEQVELNEAPY